MQATATTAALLGNQLRYPPYRRGGERRSLVGVGVVVVVLDAPGLKGVDEGRKHDGAHDVLQQLVLAEAAVPAVVPHHKHLQCQAASVRIFGSLGALLRHVAGV